MAIPNARCFDRDRTDAGLDLAFCQVTVSDDASSADLVF